MGSPMRAAWVLLWWWAGYMGSLVGLTGPRSSWLPGFSCVEAASNWLANLSHEVPDYRTLGDPGASAGSLLGLSQGPEDSEAIARPVVGEVGSWGCCHTTGRQSWSWESSCRDQGSQTWCQIVRWVCGAEVPDTFGYRVCGVLKVVLACGSDDKASAHNAKDPESIPWSGRSPGEGNDTPLRYSS